MIQAAPGGDVNAAFFITVWVVAFPGTLGVAVLCVCLWIVLLRGGVVTIMFMCCSFLCCCKYDRPRVRFQVASVVVCTPVTSGFSPGLELSCGYRLPPSPGWFSRSSAGFYLGS